MPLRWLARRISSLGAGNPKCLRKMKKRPPSAGTRGPPPLQLPIIGFPGDDPAPAAAATRPLADAQCICWTCFRMSGRAARKALITAIRSASVTEFNGLSVSLPCWMLATLGCT
jgi:hypothetical protein